MVYNKSSKHRRALHPVSRPAGDLRFVGFDIEATSSADFLMATIVYDSTDRGKHEDGTVKKKHEITKTFYDAEKFIEFLMTNPIMYDSDTILVAHNMAYDLWGTFQDTKYMHKVQPLMRKSRMISAKVQIDPKRKLKFFDTMNHLPMTLESIGLMLGFPKAESPDFIGLRPKDKEEWKIMEEYCIQDSKVCKKGAEFLHKKYRSFGSQFKCTVGSNAMDIFKRKYLKEPLKRPDLETMNFILSAYTGGRTEALCRGPVKPGLRIYDINSLYPSCMIDDYPNSNYEYSTDKMTLLQINKYEGVCEVKLWCPYMHIPYLGVKYGEKNEQKLLFPYGKIKGVFTHFEIREAIKLGYKIEELGKGVYYTRTHKLMRDYVNDFYNMRLKANNKADKQFYKLLLNNLYGKWGTKPEVDPDCKHIDEFEQDEFFKMYHDDSCEMDIVGNWVYYGKKTVKHIAAYLNPIYAVYTTAYARHMLYMNKPDDVLYWDTDSYATYEKMEVGDGLGELKVEVEVKKKGVFVKPKLYQLDEMVKAKGIKHKIGKRLTQENFQHIIDEQVISVQKFIKFKEGIRRGLKINQLIDYEKNLDLNDTKRVWVGDFDAEVFQRSEPIKVDMWGE